MNVADQVVVVTGGASGIGEALCERCHAAGAKMVVVADKNYEGARTVAARVGGAAVECDVAKESDVARLIEYTEASLGPIGLFCSNAGIAIFNAPGGDVASAPNEGWERSWAVNVMSHVYAARALVPKMKARGGGYFLITISAAGLLTQLESPVYATTKHAAVGFAEALAIAHRDDGIRVSILCPQGVDTPLLRAHSAGPQHLDGVLSATEVADLTLAALARETFVILPHPQVEKYMQRKTADYSRWIERMVALQKSLRTQTR
jgi:NAD(P)-dependent dehydrogenase (short-subunit alcohol dehydrogenase family)